jgi:hypothetical protein
MAEKKKKQDKAGLPSPMVVVLDLDATLIYSMPKECYEELKKSSKAKLPKFDYELDDFVVFKRPFVDYLFRFFIKYHVPWAVWTAGTKEYAKDIVSNLLKSYPKTFKPLSVYSQNDCVPALIHNHETNEQYQWDYCKPLSKLSRALKMKVNNFIMVDDIIDSVCFNLANWIPISEYDNKTYNRTKKDDTLKRIADYLLHLKQIHDEEPTLDLRQMDHSKWCHTVLFEKK